MTLLQARTELAAIARARQLRAAAAAATAVLAITGLIAPTASARSQTLHFFQESGPTSWFNSAGHPINLNPPATLPVAGDRFYEGDLDFAGTATHHARHFTASDELTCTFTNADTAACDVEIAIGGSMLLSNDVTMHFNLPNSAVPINGGTGIYGGVHGSFTDVNLPNSQNATLTVRLP